MLEVRLARLALPLPLELSIRRALVFPERAAQHEGLVLSWELSLRILAGSMWAACREIGATSTALETAAKNLDRPSFGHWVELARACTTLLRGRTEAAAAPFAATLAGLEQPIPSEGGLRQLTARITTLPAKSTPKPRRVQDLLDALPFYRNAAQSTHGDVPPSFREESVPALLEGLIDFCERVPLTGSLTMIYVRRLERATTGHVAEIARLSGSSVSWSTRTFDESLWKRLSPARTYLFQEPDLVVPLFPMAAVSSSGADWHVGWYARQVHAPTVAYQGVAGNEFQLVLAPDELRALTSGGSAPADGVNAAALLLEPFRGLLSYDEEHAVIFHGREENTEAALARIEARGTLLVFGASGSGKSSWVKAGIVPALRVRAALAGRRIRLIVMLPGDRPLAALRHALTAARAGTPEDIASWARAVDDALPDATEKIHAKALAHLLRGLAAQGETPVLVVDQLEEAATSSADAAQAKSFLELLATAAASASEMGVVVLTSVRADLLAPLIEHEPVRAWLASDGEPIGSIPPERLTRVIVDPLHGRGVGIEPGLAETIVSDVASEPGSLALLSQVLTTLWQERERFGGALTKQGYVDAGRVSGALEKQAEAALAEVVAAAQPAEAALAEVVAAAQPASESRARGGEAGRHAVVKGAGPLNANAATNSAVANARVETGSAARRVDRVFRALAQSEENQRFARRRIGLRALASELATSEAELRALTAPFVKRRLVVFGGDAGGERTIEVAHERLLDAWPRLKNLLASEREVLELRREVEHAAESWRASDGQSELWTDGTSKLRRAEELLASERLDLDERGRAFLVASRAGVRRRKRIERAVLSVVAVLAIAAGILAFQAYRSSQRADLEAANARAASKLADSRAEEARIAADEARAQSRRADGEAAKARDSAEVARLAAEESARQESLAKATLEDLLSLSAIQDLKELEERADALWPADPEKVPAYEAWLSEARFLIEGQAEDKARGVKKRASLAEHEAKLLEIRRKAKPLTAEQRAEIESARKSSPGFAAWEKSRAELQWLRRMLGDELWPSESEVEVALASETLPSDAKSLNDLAWPLVDPDPAKVVHGSEVKALVLAKRAVAAAQESERAMYRDTLAWALYRTGRFQEARAEEQRAVSEIEPTKKAEYEGYLANLETAIARWSSEAARAERHTDAAQLADRMALSLERDVTESRPYDFEEGDARWWHAQLSKLVSDLKAFTDEESGGLYSAGTSEKHGWAIVKRAEFARTIEERSVSGPEAQRRWEDATLSIAASPKYGGLRITPQLGLLPIGADPASGLWEFWHLQSGAEPLRGADDKLLLNADTSLVLVLIPAGTFTLGAQKLDAAQANYDPDASEDETPYEVNLDAYFLSKYEMTQGQWEYLTGGNPSQYGPSTYASGWNRDGKPWSALHPVEQVTWHSCARLLARIGLVLPTEAQWERGCRGSTSSVYWSGDDPEALVDVGNVSDQFAKKNGGGSWSIHESWNDGNVLHAAVGSYQANGLGLHDTHGNVFEWCRDLYGTVQSFAARDGERQVSGARARVFRGGSFSLAASGARSASRTGSTPESQSFALGLRPARASSLSASQLHPPGK